MFGRIGESLLLGLSGYPTSCLSNAHVLLVPLARRITSAMGRMQFYTVRIEDGQALPAFKASGDITSMAHADGYVTIPADVESIEAGTMVRVTYFE